MNKKITIVQETFDSIYNLDLKYLNVYHLFEDGEQFKIGELAAYNIATSGHTPDCLSYAIGDAVLSGGILFMLDYGTARRNFSEGQCC
ncbi:hypothetical protein E0409_15005 [Acinetobacter sp. ANC 4862]|nr:hypothetical protein E0409_15005 [Acinetobacter sp. ANC 4862]